MAALQVFSKCSHTTVYALLFRQPAPCPPTGSRVLKRLLRCERSTVNQKQKHTGHILNGMLKPYEPMLMTLFRLLDAYLGAVLFFWINSYFDLYPPHAKEAGLIIFILSISVFHQMGIYRSWRFSSIRSEIHNIFSGCFILYAILFLIGYFLEILGEFGRVGVITWTLLWPVLLSAERVFIRLFLRHFRRKGHNLKRAVIAGVGEMETHLVRLISNNPWAGTEIKGVFDDRALMEVSGFPYLGSLKSLPDYVKKEKIDIVYIALPLKAEEKIQSILKELGDSTASVYFIPNFFFLDLVLGGSVLYFENFPVVALRDSPIRGINTLFKRIEDLFLATLILIILSPVMLIIAAAIKFTSRGPILFKQWRYGLNGESILVYKFRTMTVCEDGIRFKQATKNDPRVTRVGAFLRRNSLDELPQLINVIQGRMSLVGPRPHPVAMNEAYRKLVPGYMLRHKVKPGITGLAQIKGFRGETDTLEKMEKRIVYDLEYLRQWSLFTDLKIIVKTILNGSWRTNAY